MQRIRKIVFTHYVVFSVALISSLIFSISGIISTDAIGAQFNPEAGNYYVHVTEKATFHTYTTPTLAAASASVVIETAHKLIIQDVQQNKTNNEELLALIKFLNKPVDRIYISHNHDHHWAGLEMFENIPIYASKATIESMKKDGETVLAGLKTKFGKTEIPYKKVVIPSHVQNTGEEVIDGVKIVFSTPFMQLTGPVTFMEFPEQSVLLHHHFAYVDVHVPMPPADLRVQALKEMKLKGYSYFIGGHGTPCSSDKYFKETIGYFTRLDEAVKQFRTPEEAIDAMKKTYPEWGGLFLLEAIMPKNYKKK